MRKRGGAIVEKFEHPDTKRTAVIRLDKSTMYFHTTIEAGDGTEETFESKDGDKVRGWLRAQLEHATDDMKIEWEPVVEVEIEREDRFYRSSDGSLRAEIDISVDRYYLGLTPNHFEWRKLSWKEADPKSATKLEPGLMYARSDRFGTGPKAPRRDGALGYHHDKLFTLPSFDGRKSILRYTPELWDGLKEIIATTKRARKTIEELITSKKGVESLIEIGKGNTPLLLGSGE